MDKLITCTPELSTSITLAYSQALQQRLRIIRPEHLAISILKTGHNDLTQAIKVMNGDRLTIAGLIQKHISPDEEAGTQPRWYSRLRVVFDYAKYSAGYRPNRRITTSLLMLSLLKHFEKPFVHCGLTREIVFEGLRIIQREELSVEDDFDTKLISIVWVCPTCKLKGCHNYDEAFSENVGLWHTELAPSCPDRFYETINPIGVMMMFQGHANSYLSQFPIRKYRSSRIVMCSKCKNEFFDEEFQENWSGRPVVCPECYGDGMLK